MVFDDDFYPVFTKKVRLGFRICKNNKYWCYGKELNKEICRRYNVSTIDSCVKDFAKELNDAYRDYARVCHIQIRYDTFTDKMKEFLKDSDYYLCELQNMTNKELFAIFNGSSFEVLSEAAENIYTYEEPKIINLNDEDEY